MTLPHLVDRLLRDQEGQDLLEYALLGTFISLMAVVAADRLGEVLNEWYMRLSTNVNTAAMSAS